MVETIKIAILGKNYTQKVAQTLTHGECSNTKQEENKPPMDPFYDMPPLEEDDAWKKKMEKEFFAMKEKVFEKTEGFNLSYEDIVKDQWNLPRDFKMPKIAKYKGIGNLAIHAQQYLFTMAHYTLPKS